MLKLPNIHNRNMSNKDLRCTNVFSLNFCWDFKRLVRFQTTVELMPRRRVENLEDDEHHQKMFPKLHALAFSILRSPPKSHNVTQIARW